MIAQAASVATPQSPSESVDSRLETALGENAALRKKIGNVSDTASNLQLQLKSEPPLAPRCAQCV